MNLEHEFWIDLGDIGQHRALAKGCCTAAPRDFDQAQEYYVLVDSITVDIKGVTLNIEPLIGEPTREDLRLEFIGLFKDFQGAGDYRNWELEDLQEAA